MSLARIPSAPAAPVPDGAVEAPENAGPLDDRGSKRLFDFVSGRGRELPHRGHAIGVRELRLQPTVLLLVIGNLQGNSRLCSEVCEQFDLFSSK